MYAVSSVTLGSEYVLVCSMLRLDYGEHVFYATGLAHVIGCVLVVQREATVPECRAADSWKVSTGLEWGAVAFETLLGRHWQSLGCP